MKDVLGCKDGPEWRQVVSMPGGRQRKGYAMELSWPVHALIVCAKCGKTAVVGAITA